MESLIERDKVVAKKKGTFAAAAWGGTVLLGVAAGPSQFGIGLRLPWRSLPHPAGGTSVCLTRRPN